MEEVLTVSLNVTVSIWVTGIAHYTCTRWNMIHYLTFGILATASTTRILAFVSSTSFVRWTVRVKNTFRATSLVRITVVLRQTFARADTILLSTISIRTARVRNTRCGLFIYRWSLHRAQSKWISNVSSQADTHRSMTNNTTLGILGARIRTWIFAFIVDASEVASAFGTRNAFGTTVWCRADIAWQTWARRWTSNISTFSIGPTRWRSARIGCLFDLLNNYLNETWKFVGAF